MDPATPLLPADFAFVFDIGQASDTGLMRSENEDHVCALVLPACTSSSHAPVLLAVADGMGGEEAGEIASDIAITNTRVHAAKLAVENSAPDPAWLQALVSAVNDSVVAESAQRGHPMGSTLVLALLWNNQAWLANVGDSRIYLLREGALKRLVKDHSLVQVLVDQGVIEDAERYTHSRRNLITRSLGDAGSGVTDDNPPLPLAFGDCLLLCSDGLWEMVRDDAIASVLAHATSAQAACTALVALANINGGEDNISAVVVRVLH